MQTFFKLICLLALTIACQAYDRVGHVAAVEGSLRAIDLGQTERALTKGSDVFLGDTLITGPFTRGEIQFLDETLLLLIPESQFSIDRYSSKGRFSSTLSQGGIRVATGLIAKKKPENFEIGTPNATIGVRGTLLEARMLNGNLYVGSSSGRVTVANQGGSLGLGSNEQSQFASVSSPNTSPDPLNQRPNALDLANFEVPAGGISFGNVSSPVGAAATGGASYAGNNFAWGVGLGSVAVIGTVVGVVVGSATQSQNSFSH